MTDIFIPKKPPIFTWSPPPTFRSDYERQKYWAGEKKKWIEGVDHLTGTHYHYLKEQKIKDRVSGKTIRPLGRESDMLIHEEVRDCMKDKQPSAMVKCRGIGLSTLGGSLTNYFMRVKPGSTSLITSADQPRIAKLYTDKIKVTNINYHPDIRYRVSQFNATQSRTYLQLEVKHLNEVKEQEVSYSDVFCNQTNDSDSAASSFSGTGAAFGFYDEIALNKRRKALLQSSMECYRNQLTGELDGFLLCGGTVEDTLTNEDLLEFQKLVLDAEAYNMRVLFIPYWWRFADENGYVDQKKGEEWWNKEEERLSKLEDTSHLRAFMKNNPRSLDDIFNLAKGSYFEEDIMNKISMQLDMVRKDPKIQEVPHTITVIGDKIEVKAESKGKILILEHVKEGVDYIETIDGVASGKKSAEDSTSKVASLIWKLFDPDGFSYCPVALYYEKPNAVIDSYIYSVNMGHYYNKFGNFKKIAAEGNAGTSDHFSTFLETEGLAKWIMFRKDLSGKGNSNTKKFFQYVTDDVRVWQIKQMNIFLSKYIQNIRMKSVLIDWLKGSNENADIRDSSLMFPVYTGANFDRLVKKPVAKVRKRPSIVIKDGKSIRVWK